MPEPTADPTLEFTELKLGKKTYKLIFDFEALAQAEAATGLSLMLGIHWPTLKLVELRGMLLGSMMVAQPKVTLKEVTALLRSPRNISAATDAVIAAWSRSRSQEEQDEQNPPTPEPAAAA